MPSAAPPEPDTVWSAPPPGLTLRAGEIHLWRTELDGRSEDDVARLHRTLASDERARAARFVFAPDRRRFTVGRAALRAILARYLETAPDTVVLGRTPEGRPTLVGTQTGALAFSVSRSAGLAVYAVTSGRAIGVDIEHIVRGVAADVTHEGVLSPDEIAALRALAPEARDRAFFVVWARKEAYAKARGLGLALPFDRFSVSADPAAPALLAADDDDPARWTLRDVDVAAGYASALAVEGRPERALTWSWAPELSAR
jgi:4'-phosphopantetheinyl transferase